MNSGDIPDSMKSALSRGIDGALGDTGRIVIRESGTEPVVRVMVEAETAGLCEEYAGRVIEVIREKGHGEEIDVYKITVL